MKYKVAWSSPRQGVMSTTVDAINIGTAQEQVKSMYSDIDGFGVISTSPVFDDGEEESYDDQHSSDESSRGDGDSFSTMVGSASIFVGAIVALFGLFILPAGIIAMIIGGSIGWLGMKLGFWLSDRGW